MHSQDTTGTSSSSSSSITTHRRDLLNAGKLALGCQRPQLVGRARFCTRPRPAEKIQECARGYDQSLLQGSSPRKFGQSPSSAPTHMGYGGVCRMLAQAGPCVMADPFCDRKNKEQGRLYWGGRKSAKSVRLPMQGRDAQWSTFRCGCKPHRI